MMCYVASKPVLSFVIYLNIYTVCSVYGSRSISVLAVFEYACNSLYVGWEPSVAALKTNMEGCQVGINLCFDLIATCHAAISF